MEDGLIDVDYLTGCQDLATGHQYEFPFVEALQERVFFDKPEYSFDGRHEWKCDCRDSQNNLAHATYHRVSRGQIAYGEILEHC